VIAESVAWAMARKVGAGMALLVMALRGRADFACK